MTAAATGQVPDLASRLSDCCDRACTLEEIVLDVHAILEAIERGHMTDSVSPDPQIAARQNTVDGLVTLALQRIREDIRTKDQVELSTKLCTLTREMENEQ